MKHAKARRKDAVIRELASLGLTQTGMCKALGKISATVSSLCKRAGVKPARETGGWAPVTARSKDRAASMVALYRAGCTLEQIGAQYGITRERVRQLMTKHFGTRSADGGKRVVAEAKRERQEAARDAKSLLKWGCTYEQYAALRNMRKPTRAYANQANAAAWRGIGWELNLWQWWTIWQQSGHWADRGRGQGYVMCRFGDTGPYAVGNVFIATAAENSSEGQRHKRIDPSLPIGVSRTATGNYVVHRAKKSLGTYPSIALARAAYLRGAVIDGAVGRRPRKYDLPTGIGVLPRKATRPYRAYFYVGSRQVYVGAYASVDEAVKARAQAMAHLPSTRHRPAPHTPEKAA